MDTLDELYFKMLKKAVDGELELAPEGMDPRLIDCLTLPDVCVHPTKDTVPKLVSGML